MIQMRIDSTFTVKNEYKVGERVLVKVRPYVGTFRGLIRSTFGHRKYIVEFVDFNNDDDGNFLIVSEKDVEPFKKSDFRNKIRYIWSGQQAMEYLKTQRTLKDNILSIWVSEKERPCIIKNRTEDKFFKVNFEDLNAPPPKSKNYGVDLATKEDVQSVFEWAKKRREIIVHCAAGISRSSTMAFGILLDSGATPDEAAKMIREINPKAMFNTHLLGLFSDVLKIEYSELSKAYEENF